MAEKLYTAKTPHKRACDLCGRPILVGDRVVTWPWVNPDEGPGSGRMGNIMRVHRACHAVHVANDCNPESFTPGLAFEEYDAELELPQDGLGAKAAAALAADRLEVPAASIDEVVRRIEAAAAKIPLEAAAEFGGEHVSAFNLARHVVETVRRAAAGDPYAWLVKK